jgi:type I restriction enzyme, S subunit
MNRVSLTTIGDLVEFQRGFDLPKSDFKNGNIPVVSSNGILGYHNEYKVRAPGITIGRSGTVGLPHYIEENFFPHNTALFIKDFKGNHPRYIYYLLKTLGLGDRKTGSGVPTMNRNHLYPLKVNAHLSFETQEKVANTLACLDRKIEFNNAINSEAELFLKSIYDYWFVQFDFPNEQGLPYKENGGKLVWNEEIKQNIPVGWSCSNILTVANLLGGGTPTKKNPEYWNGSLPFFTPTDADGSIFKYTTEEYITKLGLENSSTRLFEENTLFITARGSIGRLVLAGVKMAMNQSCYALRAKEGIGHPYLFNLTKELIRHLKIKASGSVFDSIVMSDIENSKFAIPDKKLIHKFDQATEGLFSLIGENSKENSMLAEIRDWLLPMIMNGQVKFK